MLRGCEERLDFFVFGALVTPVIFRMFSIVWFTLGSSKVRSSLPMDRPCAHTCTLPSLDTNGVAVPDSVTLLSRAFLSAVLVAARSMCRTTCRPIRNAISQRVAKRWLRYVLRSNRSPFTSLTPSVLPCSKSTSGKSHAGFTIFQTPSTSIDLRLC